MSDQHLCADILKPEALRFRQDSETSKSKYSILSNLLYLPVSMCIVYIYDIYMFVHILAIYIYIYIQYIAKIWINLV